MFFYSQWPVMSLRFLGVMDILLLLAFISRFHLDGIRFHAQKLGLMVQIYFFAEIFAFKVRDYFVREKLVKVPRSTCEDARSTKLRQRIM